MADPRRLGCNGLDIEVYSLHEKGKSVTQIARMLGIGAGEARHSIVKVWQLDKEAHECGAKLRSFSTE